MSKETWATHTEQHADDRRYGLQRLLLAAAVLVVGLAATFLAGSLQYAAAVSDARIRFAEWSEERRQRLRSRFDAHVGALYAVRSFFDSSEFVSQQGFDRFTSDSLERHPHIRSIDFLRRVAHPDRTRFEEICRELFDREFFIFDYEHGRPVPAARREEYAPIVYTQPTAAEDQVGRDVAIDPRSAAAMRAADERRSSSAQIVPLRSAGGGAYRLIEVYLPVYPQPSAGVSPLSVVLSPAGYVRVRFVLEDVLADIIAEARAEGIDFDVRELAVDAGARTWAASAAESGSPSSLTWNAEIAIADRKLHLRATATPRYEDAPRLMSMLPFALTGMTITLLGAFAAYQLARSRQLTEQSEVRHRVLVENSPDAILLYQRGRVVFVNRAAVALFGAQTEEQLLGMGVFDLLHPDFHAVSRERLARMLSERVVLPPLETRLIRLDGSVVEAEIISVPYVNNEQVTLQVTVRDITERRRAEQERARLEAALRQSQRLEAIGTLTGGIAHDFNNILSAVVGNIELLLQDLPESHPAWRSAQEIRSASRRARDLVKRLMAFSRHQETPRTVVELAPLIAEVQQLLRPALPAGIALLCDVPSDTPDVVADATQLHQVLVNLCTNAWQSMTSGHGVITITTRTADADEARRDSNAALEGAARYVCIEVRDTGVGIPREVIDRIFEPFFTTKRAGEGSGLGLAMVHGIVQSHKGAIAVSSQLGVGTSFRVYLPASESRAAVVKTSIQPRTQGSNQRILYIDDEEPLVYLVERMLRRGGYHCKGETDAGRAIAAVRSDPTAFDLAITDLNMPTMSGIEVARELRQLNPDLPIVITSGYIRAEDVALTRSLGVRDVVLKPDTIEELLNIVDRYVQPTGDASK